MPDGADVRLVDAHAERVRGDDDVRLAAHERVLHAGARLGRHARVVGGRVEHRRDLFRGLARAAVDDGGAVRGHLHARLERGALAGDRALAVEREDVEREVRAVEAGADALGFPEAEPRDDLLGHLRGRRGGAGHRRRVAELPDDRREAQVVRAEVVAPLRHAVRLVHHEQRERASRDRLPERGAGEPLGGGERHLGVPVADVAERGLIVLARRQHHGRVAEVGEPLALVAHERDQRGHHDRQVRRRERGQLVTEALAPAGRHHHERVAPVERGLHRLALAGPETREPDEGEQLLGRRVRGRARRALGVEEGCRGEIPGVRGRGARHGRRAAAERRATARRGATGHRSAMRRSTRRRVDGRWDARLGPRCDGGRLARRRRGSRRAAPAESVRRVPPG